MRRIRTHIWMKKEGIFSDDHQTTHESTMIESLTFSYKGRSPGLVVMGRDSRSKDRGFESRHRILDGHFFTYICSKICNFFLKITKINKKESRCWPIFFKKNLSFTQPSCSFNNDVPYLWLGCRRTRWLAYGTRIC